MNCLHPVHLRGPELPYLGLDVGCGKCLACRIQRRKEWQLRMLHELHYHDDACFITLTYNDDNLPANNSLKKSDLQKFFKRLRKKLEPKKIKYFASGEYGDQTDRPHYHAIIYGVQPDKKLIDEIWQLGIVHVGLAESESIQYVAGYIHSKLSGDEAKKEYDDKQREAVFSTCSQGIGKRYATDNREQMQQLGKITMHGVPYSIPRYYIKREALKIDKDRAIEKEREITYKHIGVKATREELQDKKYNYEQRSDLRNKIIKSKEQHDRNLHAKINQKSKKI